MDQWWLGLPVQAQAMIVLVLGLPYIGIAAGRLQPRKNVEDWRDAYFKSEAARGEDRDTTKTLLAYAEATDRLLRTTLAPPPGVAPKEGSRGQTASETSRPADPTSP